MRADHVAVIGREDHQRIVRESQIVEFLEDAPYLVVDVLDHSVIDGRVLANAFGSHDVAKSLACPAPVPLGHVEAARQFHLVAIDHAVIRLGDNPQIVRRAPRGGYHEVLVRVLVHQIEHLTGDLRFRQEVRWHETASDD